MIRDNIPSLKERIRQCAIRWGLEFEGEEKCSWKPFAKAPYHSTFSHWFDSVMGLRISEEALKYWTDQGWKVPDLVSTFLKCYSSPGKKRKYDIHDIKYDHNIPHRECFKKMKKVWKQGGNLVDWISENRGTIDIITAKQNKERDNEGFQFSGTYEERSLNQKMILIHDGEKFIRDC
ncbi:hypothetical protein AGMMS49587_00470 [Spirochaetia bacterium]|nr:hypothetical protein AGMMS49587_00470 [Spirochaetia bacterium]